MRRPLLVAAALLALTSVAYGANVNRDANGWTVVTPSVDSRIIYVSSSGSDANDGLSTATPKLTLSAAMALVRDGFPDHLRLKCGDVWTNQSLADLRHIAGRGTDEPIVFENYTLTTCSARPSLQTNGSALGSFISRSASGTTAHIYIQGIDFYDKAKDPSAGGSNAAPNVNGINFLDGGNDILVEDCWFHFLFVGAVFQYVSGPSPQNLTIRRNVFTDMYNGGGGSGHAQGMYMEGLVGTNLIEENLFQANGWNVAGGAAADVFNHHIYIADSQGITVQNNTFGTDSSLSLKFVYYGNEPTAVPALANNTIYDNTFYEGEVGISMAADSGATCYATTGCITGASVSWNVLTQVDKSPPTGRAGVGWGIEIKDIINSTISNNLCSDFNYNSGQFCIGMDDDLTTAVSGSDTISNNLSYKVGNTGLYFQPTSHWSSVTVSSNAIQAPPTSSFMVQTTGSFPYTGLTYSGNVYNPTSTSFASIGGVTTSYATWITNSGETGSSNTAVSYPAPTRTLDTYAASIGRTDAATMLADFRNMSKNNWRTDYLAPAINCYMWAGFGITSPACVSSNQPPNLPGGHRPWSLAVWVCALLAVGLSFAAARAHAERRRQLAAVEQRRQLADPAYVLALDEMHSEGFDVTALREDRGEPLFLPRTNNGTKRRT